LTTTQESHGLRFDFSGVAIVAFAVLPLTSFEPPFYVRFATFSEVFTARFRLTSPYNDTVPFCLFLWLTFTIFPGFMRCQVKICYRLTALRVTYLWIRTKPPN
jgi:hypothetical protein